MVFCPTCNREVLPVVNPHDTISKYCPACSKPITGLAGRKVFWIVWTFAFFGGIAAIATIAVLILRQIGNLP
jgi:hypothetical protein